MGSEDEKNKGFKVQDRRRFSAEGESRSEADPPKDEPETRTEQEGPSRHEQKRAESAFEMAKPANGHTVEALDEITFASFVVGLSTEALALLGEMPHPATGERMK